MISIIVEGKISIVEDYVLKVPTTLKMVSGFIGQLSRKSRKRNAFGLKLFDDMSGWEKVKITINNMEGCPKEIQPSLLAEFKVLLEKEKRVKYQIL